MALMEIDELEAMGADRFVFPKGNKVRYFMDFQSHMGVPSDRVFFKADVIGDSADLVAIGYGAQGAYGNGSIFVPLSDLPSPLA